MNFFLVLLLIPLSSLADRIIDPSEEGRATEYNEAGWGPDMNPWTRQIPIGCQGDHCPDSYIRKMADNSSKIYDFILTTNRKNSHELAYLFGYSEKIDQSKFQAAILIFNEIQESLKVGESKKSYLQRQVAYVRSSEDLEYRRLKAVLMDELVFRINYIKRNQ